MPTDIYGGYSSIKSNQLALVNINYKDGKHEHRIFSIYTIWQSQLHGLEGEQYNTKLHELLKNQVMFDKSGKKKNKILNFNILKAPIQVKQLVKVGKNHIILSSAAYYYPVDQLYLNDEVRKQLMDYVLDTEFIYHKKTDDVNKARQKTAMRSIIEDIIYNVIPNNYPIFGQTNINKIQKGYEDKGDLLLVSEMRSLIRTLLFLLHANTSLPAIKELGINSISLQQKNIVIPDDDKFIYTSPSGLTKKSFLL